jgi:hypothetical protein
MTFGIFIVYKYAEIITHFGDFVNREWGMGLGEGVKVRGEGKQERVREWNFQFRVPVFGLPHFCAKSKDSWLLRERVVR